MSETESKAEETQATDQAAEAGQEGVAGDVLSLLDLSRGEVDDDDLSTLEAAINTLDFATRRASPERMGRLRSQHARLGELVDQIAEGVRRPTTERGPLSEEDEQRYQDLVDQGVEAGQDKDLGVAMELLEEAVRLNPEGPDGLFYLGVVYGYLAHHNVAKMEFYDNHVRDEVFVEKAQICYDRVLELEPEHLPSLNNLATLYAMRDQDDQAIELLRRIVQIEPKDDEQRRIIEKANDQLTELESI